jgi:NAD(P)-dependent dehydrogenase (short-subunit alcohol dehydrogenase family)
LPVSWESNLDQINTNSRHLLDLSGRTVVVTGGNRGIGLGLARGVAMAGANVCVWARNEGRNASAVTELHDLGAEASAVTCDVRYEESVTNALELTVRRFGRVDALFANAGVIGKTYRFIEMPLSEWQEVMRTNLDGSFLCMREAARHMITGGHRGALICVSSISAIHGATRREQYGASKAALLALVRGLAVELGPAGIRCNALLPGWTESEIFTSNRHSQSGEDSYQRLVEATTQRTPVRRWATASDFESVAAFLADPTISYHTGDTIVVDGGYTIF